MSQSRPQLPNPIAYPYTAGFWSAAARGRLVAQRCTDCGAHRYPPLPACYRCQSLQWDWQDLPGTGTVFSYFWSHHPVTPELSPLGIYNGAVIETDGAVGEPLRLMSWVTGVTRETLQIGLRVIVHFDPVDAHMALPIFKPL
jgi:uncharacterized OB-fold protein